VITWDEFRQDFKAHHIPQSVVESKREEFRNLKQGSLSVYQYNIVFQRLARFAKQDITDGKSMISCVFALVAAITACHASGGGGGGGGSWF